MKKILIIEDNKQLLENTAEILELSNYRVYTAEDGKTGIEQAIAVKPDLILCDIMMPGLDGYGVLHMTQSNPELQQTPFIFLTAKSDQSDVRKGMSLGADDYIPKPFDATDLLNTVESRIKKAEQYKRKISQDADDSTEGNCDAILKKFVDGRHLDHYKKRQRIFSEGNHPIRLYYVQKGKVKLFKANEDGKELISKIVNEGEFFGYIGIFENSVYKGSADALEDCDIAAIPRSEFEELLQQHPQVMKKFLRLLATDVADRDDHLLHIAYNSLRKKVADALIILTEKYKDHPGEFNIHLSRENLAAVAGTATESLIRTLTDFKCEKLIDIKDGNITVLNMDRLKRLAN